MIFVYRVCNRGARDIRERAAARSCFCLLFTGSSSQCGPTPRPRCDFRRRRRPLAGVGSPLRNRDGFFVARSDRTVSRPIGCWY
jgi:hypothetical protein